MRNLIILISLLTLLPDFALSQTVNNGAQLTLTEGAVFTHSGFTNNGTFTNNGRLYISGAWTNNGDYIAPEGSLVLFGESAQDVNHNSTNIPRLELAGQGDKILNSDIIIDQELILNDGVMVTNSDSKLIVSENATVTGGSDFSFIEGPMVHRGPGNKLFTVGVGDTYYPITFNELMGSDIEMEVEVTSPNPLNNLSGILEAVTENVAWKVSVLNGNWDGSIVEMAVRDGNFNGISQDIVAVHGKSDGAYQSVGQSDFAGTFSDGTITSAQKVSYELISYGFLAIDPQPAINVFNAVSPNGDGLHDFLFIENIEAFPNNEVYIYNRFGDRVFQVKGYKNDDTNFRFVGNGNVGGYGVLPDGTYYYTIDPGSSNTDKTSGFIVLKR